MLSRGIIRGALRVHLKVFDRASGRVSTRLPRSVTVCFTYEGKDPPPRFFPFFLQFIHVSRSVGGRLLPPLGRGLLPLLGRSPRSTGISFQSPQDQPGGRRASAGLADHLLNVVIVNVIKDIAYKSPALRAIGHFSQEV